MPEDSRSVQFLSDPQTWRYACVWLPCFIDPVGLLQFWESFLLASNHCVSLGQQTHYRRCEHSRESSPKPFSVCVTQDNDTVIPSSSKTPGWQSGNEMETLTKKDPPPLPPGVGKLQQRGIYWLVWDKCRLCQSEAWWSYSNLQLYSSIKMEALLCCNYSFNTFTWSTLRFPVAGPEHGTEYTFSKRRSTRAFRLQQWTWIPEEIESFA